ncbi:hypothetical protein [Burkholderia aenigmatica]|uniref:hypothetical protein n=1 Tax=Burkholderia aenigmatica TaxID=2015348 RepID=UPI00264E477C|nr:hypothetical protein [Burkholderia aenigmatica]MDN7877764.1 hypothetical protein [Burkholderia aenigmatica]
MKLCSVSGCGQMAGGYSPLCNSHKRAQQRHGHPLMTGVEAGELRPYRQRIANCIKRNAKNPVWGMLGANWSALTDHSRAFHALMYQGEPYNRSEARAYQEVVKLADNVKADEIANVVLALYLLQHERPTRFSSDDAFMFQLVRRVMRLTDVNVGVSHNSMTGRAVRVYRDLPPRVTRLLGRWLAEVYGRAGLYIAGLETAAMDRAAARAVELNDALGALV